MSLRLVDEEWFFKTHIIIESEGGHVISSLEAGFLALQVCLQMQCASLAPVFSSRFVSPLASAKCSHCLKAISCAMKDENIHNLPRSRKEKGCQAASSWDSWS